MDTDVRTLLVGSLGSAGTGGGRVYFLVTVGGGWCLLGLNGLVIGVVDEILFSRHVCLGEMGVEKVFGDVVYLG